MMKASALLSTVFIVFFASSGVADYSSPHQPLFHQSQPSSTKPSSTTPSTPSTPTPTPQALPKKVLPVMAKPFGMPGVVGFENNKWQGTDYLGYVSNNIGIDVELLAGNQMLNLPSAVSVESRVSKIFTDEQIVPNAEVSEGPPLPFFHLLIVVYPVDQNKYVVLGNGRLFEQIQVLRKRFSPAGYWQGITWENEDVLLADENNLGDQINQIADKLATSFAKRYRAYNPYDQVVPSTLTPAKTKSGGRG